MCEAQVKYIKRVGVEKKLVENRKKKKLAKKDFDIETKLGNLIGPVYQNLQSNASASLSLSRCEM